MTTDLNWNINTWNKNYDWKHMGEEWSIEWGGSEPQWYSYIYPRIHQLLPADTILEIAPGFGRWTKYLLRYTNHYCGIDVSTKCIDFCKNRFADNPNAKFYVNDGISLGSLEDNYFDFIFSFDSLVHSDLSIHKSYIPQILSKLSAKGFAFIHHSNWAKSKCPLPKQHNRAKDVCSDSYRNIIKENNGHVILQENLNWGSKYPIDTFTIFCKKKPNIDTIFIENNLFHNETSIIKNIHSLYSLINKIES